MAILTELGVVPRGAAIGWMGQAACRALDVEMFFHGPRAGRARNAREAKRVCAGCPVIAECAAFAAAAGIPYGVWGGLTEEERGYRGGIKART